MAADETSRAIQKATAEATRNMAVVAASFAGIAAAVPVLGPSAAGVVIVGLLGHRVFSLLASERVRAAIRRMAADDDWLDFYREQLRAGGQDRVKREVLEMLRALDAAVSDEAVEPLTRLCVARTRDDSGWPLVRGLSSLLRQCTGEEVRALRTIISDALQKCPSAELVLEDDRRDANGKGEPFINVYGPERDEKGNPGERVRMLRPLRSGEVFHLLATHGVMRRASPIYDEGSSERLVVSRDDADFILSLFK